MANSAEVDVETSCVSDEPEKGNKQSISKSRQAKQRARRMDIRSERGVVYLSHIPHGFYEPQMKHFFQQFGKVTRLKLWRSKKSGKSKGFAYIEFAYEDVAEIVAETMNNYLMFQKLLKCKLLPKDDIIPKALNKSPRMFRNPYHRNMSAKRHNSLLTADTPHILKNQRRLAKREKQRNEKMKALNIEYKTSGYAEEWEQIKKARAVILEEEHFQERIDREISKRKQNARKKANLLSYKRKKLKKMKLGEQKEKAAKAEENTDASEKEANVSKSSAEMSTDNLEDKAESSKLKTATSAQMSSSIEKDTQDKKISFKASKTNKSTLKRKTPSDVSDEKASHKVVKTPTSSLKLKAPNASLSSDEQADLKKTSGMGKPTAAIATNSALKTRTPQTSFSSDEEFQDKKSCIKQENAKTPKGVLKSKITKASLSLKENGLDKQASRKPEAIKMLKSDNVALSVAPKPTKPKASFLSDDESQDMKPSHKPDVNMPKSTLKPKTPKMGFSDVQDTKASGKADSAEMPKIGVKPKTPKTSFSDEVVQDTKALKAIKNPKSLLKSQTQKTSVSSAYNLEVEKASHKRKAARTTTNAHKFITSKIGFSSDENTNKNTSSLKHIQEKKAPEVYKTLKSGLIPKLSKTNFSSDKEVPDGKVSGKPGMIHPPDITKKSLIKPEDVKEFTGIQLTSSEAAEPSVLATLETPKQLKAKKLVANEVRTPAYATRSARRSAKKTARVGISTEDLLIF